MNDVNPRQAAAPKSWVWLLAVPLFFSVSSEAQIQVRRTVQLIENTSIEVDALKLFPRGIDPETIVIDAFPGHAFAGQSTGQPSSLLSQPSILRIRFRLTPRNLETR